MQLAPTEFIAVNAMHPRSWRVLAINLRMAHVWYIVVYAEARNERTPESAY